jgi:hypothetical protein
MKRAATAADLFQRGGADDAVLRERLARYFPAGWPRPQKARIVHWQIEHRAGMEQCGLWLWETAAFDLAVLVEFPENRGCSVTNGIERVCQTVREGLAGRARPLRFVEHYPAGGPVSRPRPASWDYVVLREVVETWPTGKRNGGWARAVRTEADWVPLTPEQARALVDGAVPERVQAEEALLALGKVG